MANNSRILDTMAIHESPRITDSGTTAVDTFTVAERDQDIDRYWEDIDIPGRRRKLFPIEFWQLDLLFQKTGKVALVVRKINDSNFVTAKWVAFDSAKPPALSKNSRCFVLSGTAYTGPIVENLEIETLSYEIRGLQEVRRHGMDSNFLVALLGKSATDEYRLYIQDVSMQPIETDIPIFDTTPGGEGTGGVRIP